MGFDKSYKHMKSVPKALFDSRFNNIVDALCRNGRVICQILSQNRKDRF